MLYCDFVKSVRAGGLAQVGAKVLLADLGNGAVLAQLGRHYRNILKK